MNLPVGDPSGQESTDAAAAESTADETSTAVDKSPAVDKSTAVEKSPAGDADTAARRAATRRKLDEVFGDVLPSVTRDELDDGSDGSPGTTRDQWYRDNRPPHHE